jgi:hypothetical protein
MAPLLLLRQLCFAFNSSSRLFQVDSKSPPCHYSNYDCKALTQPFCTKVLPQFCLCYSVTTFFSTLLLNYSNLRLQSPDSALLHKGNLFTSRQSSFKRCSPHCLPPFWQVWHQQRSAILVLIILSHCIPFPSPFPRILER